MGVYEDMAHDAGYLYGSDENRQMAQQIEIEHYRQCEQDRWDRMQAEHEAWCEEQIRLDAEAWEKHMNE